MRNPIKMDPNKIDTAIRPYPSATPIPSPQGTKIRHGIPNELHTLMQNIVDMLRHANQGTDAELLHAKQQLKASLQATQCALRAMDNGKPARVPCPSAAVLRTPSSAPQCVLSAS